MSEIDISNHVTAPMVLVDTAEKPYDGWRKFLNGPVHICVTPEVGPDNKTILNDNNLFSIWQCYCGQHFKFMRGGFKNIELVWVRIKEEEVQDGLEILK